MRTRSSSRRGSALLVVLGMLAFMVISGVAFAVYMRSSRLTSSFTRRTSATRLLAKAALAEAIDQIDRSIANDPHPNIRRGSNKYNYWLGRVLLTADSSEATPKEPNQVASDLDQNPDNNGCPYTVPVLSLEALAYVPPPLVNEARFYGQKTASAAWQTLDFDAGRYAFIALDVSDYFDVNRLMADEARSSDPARRVSLAYLFEGGGAEHLSKPENTDKFESDIMSSFRQITDAGQISFLATPPCVSLADFNLAFGAGFGDFKSPFCQYVNNSDGTKGFYKVEPGNAQWDAYSRMTFVTDSLEAPIPSDEKTVKSDAGTLDVWNLDDEAYQPFPDSFLDGQQRNRTMDAVWRHGSETVGRFLNHGVPAVALCALSDYLDCDRIPISLAIPSVERVPMICGIKPTVAESSTSVKLSATLDEDKTVSGGGEQDVEKIVRRTIHWRLDPASFRALVGGGAGVDVLAVYPFRNHEKVSENSFFLLDGKVQFFLSTQNMPLRTGNRDDLLHFGADETMHIAQGNVKDMCKTPKLVGRAVFDFPLQEKVFDISTTGEPKPEDCVRLVDLALDRSSSATLINDELSDNLGDVLRVTYQWKQTPIKDQEGKITGWEPTFAGQIPKFGTAGADVQIVMNGDDKPAAELLALDAGGRADSSSILSKVKATEEAEIELFMNMAVTVRVKTSEKSILGSSDGTKTVDMVPATAYDDELLNGVLNGNSRMANVGGSPTPLMKFCGVSAKINTQSSDNGAFAVETSPKAVMINDPRYNHAPENWVAQNFSAAADWYNNLAKASAEANDGDIFMATSDQDYMQSVYEFGFLPRLSDLRSYADELRGNLGSYEGAEWKVLGEKGQPDANLMWKTYDIFGRYSDAGDDFEGLGLENLGRGFRVNPYSNSTNVIMAAFANTPYDWRAASENEEENKGANLPVNTFNGKYAWNAYSSGGKLAWEDLEAVAGEFMGRVVTCARQNEDWKEALIDLFDQERSLDTEKYLCGVQLESPSTDIYSVDKKFLFGFWRNCFAARQQLFLVFFRAEPMMRGGGVVGATPPQLGAKGVALVWRNPNSPDGSSTEGYSSPDVPNPAYKPHQTRVLFYKQFE